MWTTRRAFLLGLPAASLGWSSAVRSQLMPRVRLLVLRNRAPVPSNNCLTQCIRGAIYDVSDLNEPIVPAAVIASGRVAICDVVERPWLGNAPNVSAVPKGTYSASIRRDATKSWMQKTASRAWRIELSNVPGGRSAIQFHYGLDESWSEGCFIVGQTREAEGSYCGLSEADAALARLKSVVEPAGRSPSAISIIVADQTDFMANLPTDC